MSPTKIQLAEGELPSHWYNVAADLARPHPPYLGADGAALDPTAMSALFPPDIVEQ